MLQRNFKALLVILLVAGLAFAPKVRAQMMGNFSPSVTPSQQDLQDIQTGQGLYGRFQNKQVSCDQLKDGDFEKIGEYIMNQRFGSTARHIQMNNRAKEMMGEKGEEQMHIRIGKNTTGCNTNKQGGDSSMMGYWNYGGMMNGAWGTGFIAILFWIVIFVDAILLGAWLWKQINKK